MEDIIALMIPILGVIGFTSIAITRIVMRADERKLELKLRLKEYGGADVAKAMDELRAEIASVRDNGAQYDLSLDATLNRLERRIEFLEGGSRRSVKSADQETEPVQRIGKNL